MQTSLAHNVALRDPDRICKMQNGSFAHMRKGETVHTFCLFIESVKNAAILRSFVRMKKSTRAEIRDCRRRWTVMNGRIITEAKIPFSFLKEYGRRCNHRWHVEAVLH